MNFYLDTSVIVNFLTPEPLSSRADAFVGTHLDELVVSDFAAAEFSSVIARRVRTEELRPTEARTVLTDFDAWLGRAVLRVEIASGDIKQADAYLRRLDLPLRAPDAIHIAIAWRRGVSLVTFDRQLAAAARTLGIAVAEA